MIVRLEGEVMEVSMLCYYDKEYSLCDAALDSNPA